MDYSRPLLCNQPNDVKMQDRKMSIGKYTWAEADMGIMFLVGFCPTWLLDLNIVDRGGFCVVQLAW